MEFAEAIEKPRTNDVVLKRGDIKTNGSLAITSHHLIFQPNSSDSKTEELWLLLKSIDLCVAEGNPTAPVCNLTLLCKNFLTLSVEIKSWDDCQAVKRTVEKLSNLSDISHHYPLFYSANWELVEDGWKAFSWDDVFARLQMHSDKWRLSRANDNYQVCSSYPRSVIVPSGVADDKIKASAGFRQNNRFPVMSYFHRKTKSVLLRSGQPLVGANNRRCREDEQLLNAFLSPVSRGYIIDLRPAAAAQSAKAKGGGFEPEVCYNQWKRIHRPVPRYGQLMESLNKHVEACTTTDSDKYLSRLANAGWLQSVADVLNCAALTAQTIDKEEMSVLIHGWDGTDGTLMVTSLAQIILDPDTRTIRGFEGLVEREWLSSGHPFSSRCAHSAYARGSPAEGPTFFCFLDCVFQMYNQFQFSFEFNEKFLITLFDHAYASEFGTFLRDSEKERVDLNLQSRTVSIWSYLNRPEMLNRFMNPLYEPNNDCIWPSVAPQSLVLWDGVFLRWMVDWTQQQDANAHMTAVLTQERKLLSSVSKLRRQLAELEKEAESVGLVLP